MSYDLFVQDLPDDLDTVDDIPDDFVPRSLGGRDALIATILAARPGVDFSDRSAGIVRGQDFEVEIELADGEDLRSFVVHLRGGERAWVVALELLDALGLGALDPQAESGLVSFEDDGIANFKAWQRFSESVLDPRV